VAVSKVETTMVIDVQDVYCWSPQILKKARCYGIGRDISGMKPWFDRSMGDFCDIQVDIF
jgi:hypothetical protein